MERALYEIIGGQRRRGNSREKKEDSEEGRTGFDKQKK